MSGNPNFNRSAAHFDDLSPAEQAKLRRSMKNFRTAGVGPSSLEPKPAPPLKPHFVEGQREREAEEREKMDSNAIYMEK